MPDVTFEYDEEHEICFGKAFDNRAGCACIVDAMKQLEKEQASLAVNVVGAFAAQEEVGTRGAVKQRARQNRILPLYLDLLPMTFHQLRIGTGLHEEGCSDSYPGQQLYFQYAVYFTGREVAANAESNTRRA